MDLAQLKFVVDTSELKSAVTEIEKLGSAVNRLNKPMKEASRASSELNKEQSNTQKNTAKNVDSVKKQTSVLERQQMILEFMTQGFSKGQSSQLAYAKAAGALTGELEQLGKVLQTQRTLMGTDPFDKSIGAMQALKNEYTVIKEVQRLFNADLGLSKAQMEDLAREKLRLIEKYKLEGRSLSEVKKGLIELNTAYIQNAAAENNIVSSMKNKQKIAVDTAKANEYIIKELDRVNRLTQSNGNITSATNSKLIAFEKALKLSGLTAAEQTKKLEAYKQSLTSIQRQAGNRQVDYLSRALGPQITDVFVGLATGQSPLMVLLQQGGQLRDQFALAGVAGADMGKMLVEASKAMITSVKDVAIAVGGLLLNAVVSTGQAITTSLLAPFKLMIAAMYDMATGANTSAKAIEGLKIAMISLGRVGVLALVVAAVTAIVALKDLIKEQQEASKAANLFGGTLGLTTENLYSQAEAFAGATGRVSTYMNAISAAAKAGVSSSDNIKSVSDAIVALGKVGISAEETARRFAQIGEKPSETLREFAKQTGLVSPQVLQLVRNLEEQGRKSEAVSIATKSMSDAMVASAKKIQGEQGVVLSVFNAIASGAKNMWDAILNVGRPTSLSDQLFEAESELQDRIAKATGGRFNRQLVDADTKRLQERITGLRQQLSEEQRVSAEKKKQSEYADWLTRNEQALKKSLTESQQFELKRAEIQRDVAAGLITQVEANKALAGWRTVIFGKEDDYLRLLKQATDFYNSQNGEIQQLTRAEVALKQVKEDQDWNKLNGQQKTRIEQIYNEAAALERLKKSEEARKSQLEFIANLEGKSDKMGEGYFTGLKKLDEALVDGTISMQRYIDLLNKLYKTSESSKALTSVTSAVQKDIADIEAQRAAIASQYGMDFKTGNEKSKVQAQIKYQTDLAKAQAELEKNSADARARMNKADADAAIAEYQRKYNAQVQLSQDAFDRETYVLSEGYRRQEAYAQAFENLFSGMADALVQWAQTGKLSGKDLFNSLIADLARFELRMQMAQLYQAARPGVASFISSILPFANGGAFNGGVQAFAKGGAFTNTVVDSPTLFKFAKGTGLMGEAGPEAIMPLTRDSSGRLGVQASGATGGSVSVNIINNSNANATATETTDSRGNRKVEVVIGEMTAGEISRSGSASQKSIRSTFGIQPQLIRR